MKISNQTLNVINLLAGKYNFNVDEAVSYLTDAKADAKGDSGSETSVKSGVDKIEACRKNIAVWQKKLDDGKIADDKKEKHVEKIAKEQKKLDKLISSESKETDKKKADSTDKKEKRIKRFSPVLASQLKTALEKESIEITETHKKEFQKYVEDLTDDDYRKDGLAEHMRTFAKLKTPTPVVSETPVAAPEVAEKKEKETRIKRFTPGITNHLKAALEKEGVEFKEDHKKELKQYVDNMTDEDFKKGVLTDHMDKFAKTKKTSEKEPETVEESSDKVFEISLKELQDISMLSPMGESVRMYWDGDNGRVVQGPDRDDDEDFEEVKFNGKDYVVGQNTGRVYEALDSGDVFAGYAGVLKFKMLKI